MSEQQKTQAGEQHPRFRLSAASRMTKCPGAILSGGEGKILSGNGSKILPGGEDKILRIDMWRTYKRKRFSNGEEIHPRYRPSARKVAL